MRIIKKKKGKRNYFYLRESFRKQGKVITKDMYLGRKIPNNIEDIKRDLEIKRKKDVYDELEKIKKNFQKEWKKLPKTVKEKEKEKIGIAFTYNTNAIEGSRITLEETREIIQNKIAPNRFLYDIKETEAHYNVFLDMISKKRKITNKLILEWHYEIFKETKKDIAGEYRHYGVLVGNYRAPDWQDIKKLMNDFIKFVSVKMNPVELAARLHYRFEKIHPFGDGNGRVGRLLVNHILWWNKYPMLIIEYKKRKSYYIAFDREEDGFVNYFIRRYIAVHKKR